MSLSYIGRPCLALYLALSRSALLMVDAGSMSSTLGMSLSALIRLEIYNVVSRPGNYVFPYPGWTVLQTVQTGDTEKPMSENDIQ